MMEEGAEPNEVDEWTSDSASDDNEDDEKKQLKKAENALKIKIDLDAPLSEKELGALRDAGLLPASASSPASQTGKSNAHIVFVDDEESGK